MIGLSGLIGETVPKIYYGSHTCSPALYAVGCSKENIYLMMKCFTLDLG